MSEFEKRFEALDGPIRMLASDLRNFVLSLGPQVIEQIRPHRVAYAKTINFRVFLELVPSSIGIELIIRSGRSSPPTVLRIASNEDYSSAKDEIKRSFENIQ